MYYLNKLDEAFKLEDDEKETNKLQLSVVLWDNLTFATRWNKTGNTDVMTDGVQMTNRNTAEEKKVGRKELVRPR